MATNEMDAKLISQGTQVTSIESDALIPVAEGEGQPQKNITFSNLVNEIHGEDTNLTKASTMDYVRGLDASGNPILISKADLASVVAELIPIVSDTKKGLAPTYMRAFGWSNSRVSKLKVSGEYKFATVLVSCYKDGHYSLCFVAINNNNHIYVHHLCSSDSVAKPTVKYDSSRNVYIELNSYTNSSIGFAHLNGTASISVSHETISTEDYDSIKDSLTTATEL